MGIFGPSKGSIEKVVNDKIKARKSTYRGDASQIQAKKAKARKKEIQEQKARKKQEDRDVKRAKILALNPPNAASGKKFKAKAIAKGDKRREKKAQKKAERKAKGFWG